MSELQWNLLNTKAPQEIAQSFNPMGSYIQGTEAAQKVRMNELAMRKTENDIQYNPMKVMSQVQKNTATTNETQVKIGLKEAQLGAEFAGMVASAPPGQALAMAIENSRKLGAIMKKSPEELATNERQLMAMHQQLGEEGFKQHMADTSMKMKDKIALDHGQQRLDQGQTGLDIRQQIADQGAVANTIKQQNANNYGVQVNKPQFLNTGDTYTQNPGTGGGTNYSPIPINIKAAEQAKLDQAGQIQQLTPEAKTAAAHRYLLDGTLPAAGQGAKGTATRVEILNEAGEIAKQLGLPPEKQRQLQIETSASKSALTQVAKQEGMVGAFEKNFLKNVELAEQASKEVDRTGVPIVNKWLNAGKRAVTGDVALSKLDIAIKSVVNEYTKIISGSMGNTQMAQAEVEKVNNLLAAAQTEEQVQAVLDFMKLETANRMTGFKEQKGEIGGSMRLPAAQAQAGVVEEPAPIPGTFTSPQAQGPVSIKSEADYQALPPGTEYIAPDGSRRRKK